MKTRAIDVSLNKVTLAPPAGAGENLFSRSGVPGSKIAPVLFNEILIDKNAHSAYYSARFQRMGEKVPATLYVPTPLRKLTGGKSKVIVAAATVAELIERMETENPGFSERVLDSDGEIKRFINVFINGTDVRTLQGKATPVKDDDEVSIIPAMAGGNR